MIVALWGLIPQNLYSAEAEGKLHPIRVGQYIFYSRAEIEAEFGPIDRQRLLDYTNPSKVIERVVAELIAELNDDRTDPIPGKHSGFELEQAA